MAYGSGSSAHDAVSAPFHSRRAARMWCRALRRVARQVLDALRGRSSACWRHSASAVSRCAFAARAVAAAGI